jgi:hypothetical protein
MGLSTPPSYLTAVLAVLSNSETGRERHRKRAGAIGTIGEASIRNQNFRMFFYQAWHAECGNCIALSLPKRTISLSVDFCILTNDISSGNIMINDIAFIDTAIIDIRRSYG